MSHATDFISATCVDSDPQRKEFLRYAALNVEKSYAQTFQDLFVLKSLGEKRGGYFVELGASDGIHHSNSFLLERSYAWRGIVADPAIVWHDPLITNRGCSIDMRCVWNASREILTFLETPCAELSTVKDFEKSDHHDRSLAKEYRVKTVSFNDLLQEHSAPREMDYLSIDTEGSEALILRSLDFDRWSFRIITVEHNFRDNNRNDVHSLLTEKSYKRVLTEVSRFEDWYVRD